MWIFQPFSLSLSLSHTHIHTHSLSFALSSSPSSPVSLFHVSCDTQEVITCGVACRPDFWRDFGQNNNTEIRVAAPFWDAVANACKDVKYCPLNDDNENQVCCWCMCLYAHLLYMCMY
jgi:hypothetical protein